MALYQASSCPAGQSWPTPVACRTFNANGALADITGLSPNTSYVLMTDGIENTKATFSITFSGSSLPVTLQSFTGTSYDNYNQLNWTLSQVYDLQQVIIEKSPDGKTFESIGSISAAALSNDGTYKDAQPFLGDNYYRLDFVNLDGSKAYSNVVLLRRKDAFLVSTYPNPVQNRLYVDISGVTPGSYSFVLYNSMGQMVQRNVFSLSGYKQTIQLETGRLPQGTPISESKVEVQ
jgi:hypothetical protein